MKLPNLFKIAWWAFLLLLITWVLLQRYPDLAQGRETRPQQSAFWPKRWDGRTIPCREREVYSTLLDRRVYITEPRQVQPSLHTPRSGAVWDARLAKAGKISNLQTPQ
jgi:hypothetical protein